MSDEITHECAVAMVVLRKPPSATGDFGGTKLSLLLEKQHNRGQDGAGAAILRASPIPGEEPYWIAKSASATPLADVLGAIGRRNISRERIFLGHLRYATFGKNEEKFCHPFVHESSELARTLLLAGNFNLTNAADLFESYRSKGEFPRSRADGYLITELVADELSRGRSLAEALSATLAEADGAWTLCGMTGDGWAFSTRDPHGIRPGFCYMDADVVAVASERPAIQAAFDVPPEAVKELPPGAVLVVSPDGKVKTVELCSPPPPRACVFERIYFSRANDADIHRERKALGAALVPQILEAADSPLEDIFFSYIPNSARIAFHGLLERLFDEHGKIRFGEIAVKDAKFRTFIADAAARREFYKHVYDVTYGLVRPGEDTLVVLDDSIVRGNTMKNAILPMLDRLRPKRIVIASSAPPIRYPDCYGIDMSTLSELVAFRALVNLLGEEAEQELWRAYASGEKNPLERLYAMFAEAEYSAEIARLLTPPGMKAKVKVVYQTLGSLRMACHASAGDWYFTGDYPTPGGYKVLRKALYNYLTRSSERPY
ncbi:MAG: amidophosphoribosyltransferase [Kiritimatiellae bacterium]|nr:amidophosphoribosyltransferase [Kiritimatiellia bacterium]